MTIKILLAGDGGQGIQTMANLLTQTAFANDFYVSDIPNFGLEQRGGVSLAFLQISHDQITYPKFTEPDILLIMSEQARERSARYQTVAGVKVLDINDWQDELAKNKIDQSGYNIFFLGVLGKLLEEQGIFKIESLHNKLHNKLSNKTGWDDNNRAFTVGVEWIES